MSYLGIDFGLTRIGLAYSEGELATPLETIVATTKHERLQKVLNVIRDKQIDTVVIGTTPSTIQPTLKKFVGELRRQFPGTIKLVEEDMSSREAMDDLIAVGSTQKKRREQLDAYAATLILERYLDEKKEN